MSMDVDAYDQNKLSKIVEELIKILWREGTQLRHISLLED